MTTVENFLQQLPHLSDERLKGEYLNLMEQTETIGQMLPLVEEKSQALRVVKLALEVDVRYGAKLAGAVKPEFQPQTVGLVAGLEIPQQLKNRLLGITGSDSAIPTLWQSLSDENAEVRRSAVMALGQIGIKAAVANRLGEAHLSALTELLNHEDSDVRAWSAWALGQIGTKASVAGLLDEAHLKPLAASLNHKASHVRKWAVWVLGQIGSLAVLAPLQEALNDKDSEVRWRAALALGKIRSEAAVDPLLRSLAYDENDYVRGRAASALGEIGSESAVAGLVRSLDDPEDYVRLRGVEALGKIGNEAAVAGLVQALNHQDSVVRSRAASVLGQIGSEAAISGLVRSLLEPDSLVRGRAASALGQIGGEAAVRGLVRSLKDPEYYVRWRATDALGQIGSDAAVVGLVEALDDENSAVRQRATKSLGEIGSETAVAALRRSLTHKYDDVRKWAAETLNKISNDVADIVDFDSSFQTDYQPEKLPKIFITSHAEASEHILCKTKGRYIKYLISIGSPGVDPPKGFTQVPHRLRLEFDDIDAPVDDPKYILPSAEDILKVIEFARLVGKCDGDVLIHCQAGISRSTAVALTVCALLLGAGKEEEALTYVLRARPGARPNLWIVELADEALGRDGKLLQQLAQIYQDLAFQDYIL